MTPALSTSKSNAGRTASPNVRSVASSASITASLAAPRMRAKCAGITSTHWPEQCLRKLPLRCGCGFTQCTSWVRLAAESPQSRFSGRQASPTKQRGVCSARFGVSCPRMVCNWRVRRSRWMRCTTAERDGIKAGRVAHLTAVTKSRLWGWSSAAPMERIGRVVARVAPDATKKTLHGLAKEYILPSSTVFTDDFVSYDGLQNLGYVHRRIRHSAKIYVSGDIHTQAIEGFWSLVKRGIGGVYHNVSAKFLQTYLDEYAVRYNLRDRGKLLFRAHLERVSQRAS